MNFVLCSIQHQGLVIININNIAGVTRSKENRCYIHLYSSIDGDIKLESIDSFEKVMRSLQPYSIPVEN